ncbi:MAG: UDP-N-acetylglucosamine 2-epimerase [Tepidisphaeraceae bacterium]
MRRRRVLYVTGTRAEFGLMRQTLAAIKSHPALQLQFVVTGMHLSRAHGHTIDGIRADGWTIDAKIPWKDATAQTAGDAMRRMADAFDRLKPDIVLLAGDRVEPFSAAGAAALAGLCIAHVHGGDRAQGQLDDSLRHAITKLSHLHFPATRASAERLYQLGEDRFRIHLVGTPGLDGVKALARQGDPAACPTTPFALIALHPDTPVESLQAARAIELAAAAKSAGIERAVVVYPNNDPGWHGIARAWERRLPAGWTPHRDLPRPTFLRCLREAALLIGNSSSGIIEAATFGTPVINIGDRQRGRQRSANVIDVDWNPKALRTAIAKIWRKGRPRRFSGTNVYGSGRAARRIASILADVPLDDRLRNKLIRY